MTHIRLTTARLRQLTAELPDRYTAPLTHLSAARVLTGAQLDRLLAEPGTCKETTGRVRRRILTRLHRAGLVATLGRRVGGHHAGSSGHVYTLTTAGYTFLALLNGGPAPPRIRRSRDPGPLFLAHALTISGIYVDLIEHSRHRSGAHVAQFATEPQCWHPTGNGAYLRPDAYTVLHTRTHADFWWLEVDQATESLPRLRAKARTYRDHLTTSGTGPDGMPPRVLFTTPDQQRADTITGAVTSPAADDSASITVTTHNQAAHFMLTELTTT